MEGTAQKTETQKVIDKIRAAQRMLVNETRLMRKFQRQFKLTGSRDSLQKRDRFEAMVDARLAQLAAWESELLELVGDDLQVPHERG